MAWVVNKCMVDCANETCRQKIGEFETEAEADQFADVQYQNYQNCVPRMFEPTFWFEVVMYE